ncbi:hypothetical protein ACQ4M4_15620 [Leptolyngbya sp. AN02str]|uniref:hypothetical protein n=1 Tax=Leptolyngbya sp. AN02str TaxID=3423363 RepID=UPI003D31480B
MANRIWLGLMIIGVSGLLVSCGGRSAQAPSQAESSQSEAAGTTVPTASSTMRPIAPPDSATLRSTSAVTGNLPDELLRSRGAGGQSASIASGRTDPFVSVADQAVVIPSPSIPTRQEEVLPKPAVAPVAPPAPVVSTVPLLAPPPPPLSAFQPAPTANVPAVPMVAPLPIMAERIQISGFIQVGDRLSLIAEVPGEANSRTATVGDYLAGGQVLVKRIDSSGPEPVVVLEENGREIIRTIGSSATEIGML